MEKYNLIFVLIISCLISTCLGKSFLEGEKADEDKQVYRRFIKAPALPLTKVVRQIVYPEKGSMGGPVITCINATDLSKPNSKKGGKVTILSGGVGSTFVVLDFTSALSKGLNFDVKIHGK